MRNKSILLVALTLLAVVFAPPLFSQDAALQLFHKMQVALGGADKLAAIQDFEEIVTAEAWNGNTGASMGAVRKRTRWIRPNHLRLDQIGPGSTYVLYFDGTSGWEILPGTQDVIALVDGELKFAQGYARGFRFNTWLADRDPRYKITSPAPNVVRIAEGDNAPSDITLDPVSFLPVKIASTSLADPDRPRTSEQVIHEWGTSQGLRFIRHFTVLRSGVRVAEAKVEQTEFNIGLKLEDLAAKPADNKPVIPLADGNPR